MSDTNGNKIRRRKVSSSDIEKQKQETKTKKTSKKVNSNEETIIVKRVKKAKEKEQIDSHKDISLEEKLKREKQNKEQFELEREIYYRQKEKRRIRRIELIKKIIPIVLIFVIVSGIFFGGFTLYAISGSPKVTKELIYDSYISTETVESDQIPKDLKNAIVAMEDRRFYTHNGVDIKSIFRSVLNNIVTSSTQGGSTIDMQVSKNLLTSDEKTYKRKVLDVYNAICMNRVMTKDEILCVYLNNIYLGKSAYGVAKGADVYFRKDVSELNLAQCAMLAGITNNPYRFSEHSEAKTRQIQVLDDMLEQGYITEEQYNEAVEDPTVFASEID